MALPKNRPGVVAILQELGPRIVGQFYEGIRCNCSFVSYGPAVAVGIKPAGDYYPGQETKWVLWSVNMSYHPEDLKRQLDGYSLGLSEFVSDKELEQLFYKHFGNRIWDTQDEENEYRLSVGGEKRCQLQLPPAVRINENDLQLRFNFNWGRAQEAGKQVLDLYYKSHERMPVGSPQYRQLVKLLLGLKPEVYRGGPDPELPFESKWHLKYDSALGHALQVADHVFLQNLSESLGDQGEYVIDADVVFMKVPVVG